MKVQQVLRYFFPAALLLLMACQENKVSPSELAGEYEGVFQISDSGTGYSNSGSVTLHISGEGYVCAGNQQRLPAGGNGSFKRKTEVIEFEDENVWPPKFDMHLVLTGAFEYEFGATRLHLWKEVAGIRYEYLLEKQ
jgi:hypothetical protein